MASSINGATIRNTTNSPSIGYYVTYTSTRNSNSQVTYNFTINTKLFGGNSSWVGRGYVLTGYITVNGVQKSVVLKDYDSEWSVGSSSGTTKSTKSLSVTCGSTSANTNQTVTFQVVNYSSAFNGDSGEVNTSNYYVTSPALISTNCVAPSHFVASSNDFENNVTLAWSNASGGINNAIYSYGIQYSVSSNNSTWGSWQNLITVYETDSSAERTYDVSSYVSRGYYIKFRIRTMPSNVSYASGYKESNSVRRQPYTACTAPSTFSITTDITGTNNYETNIVLTWSGATGGTNNSINAYQLQYAVTDTTSTPSSSAWSNLQTISTTTSGYSFSNNLSSISRGKYVWFRVRTQGTVSNSSYYSSYKSSTPAYIRRNPYTQCSVPSNFQVTAISNPQYNFGAEYLDSEYLFEHRLNMSWSSATAGSGVTISRYEIQYSIGATPSDIGTSWTTLTTTKSSTLSYVFNFSLLCNRGTYLRIRIKTIANNTDYNSDYEYSNIFMRNKETVYATVTATPTSYSENQEITLSWRCTQEYSPYSSVPNCFAPILAYEVLGSSLLFPAQNVFPTEGIVQNGNTCTVSFLSGDSLNLNNYYSSGNTITIYWVNQSLELTSYTGQIISVNGSSVTLPSDLISMDGFDDNIFNHSDAWITNAQMLNDGKPSTPKEDIYSPYQNLMFINISDSNFQTPLSDISVVFSNNSNAGHTELLTVVQPPQSQPSPVTLSVSQGEVQAIKNFYNSVADERCMKIMVRPINIFGYNNDNGYVIKTIWRYDLSGAFIGVSGQWKPCKIYYGSNAIDFSECEIYAGINNAWVQCGGTSS